MSKVIRQEFKTLSLPQVRLNRQYSVGYLGDPKRYLPLQDKIIGQTSECCLPSNVSRSSQWSFGFRGEDCIPTPHSARLCPAGHDPVMLASTATYGTGAGARCATDIRRVLQSREQPQTYAPPSPLRRTVALTGVPQAESGWTSENGLLAFQVKLR